MTVGLLEACRDPELLAFDPWPEQVPILEAIDSGSYREIAAALGRRSGKSLMAAATADHDATLRDLTAYLRPGEVRHVVIVAGSREHAQIVLTFARDLLRNSPLLAGTIVGETADSITVRQPYTGAIVVIKAMALSAITIRGYATSTAIFDEIGHWMDATEGPAVASRVVRAVRPGLAQFGEHGRALYISTPWGRSGAFYEMFAAAEAGTRPGALAIQRATWEVVPESVIPASFYEDERASDADACRGEFGAEFLDSGGTLIPFEAIQAAVGDHRELRPGHAIDLIGPVGALDAAFQHDPFAFGIVGRDPVQRDRLRVALVRSWRPGRGRELDVETILGEVAETCRRHGVSKVYVDQYCSAPVRQSLQRRGLIAREVTMTATSKTAIYQTLKSKILAGELELPRHEELLVELGRVEAHYSAGSAGVRIPRVGGSHGDLAQAVAMAVYALRGRGARKQRIRSGGYDEASPQVRHPRPRPDRYLERRMR